MCPCSPSVSLRLSLSYVRVLPDVVRSRDLLVGKAIGSLRLRSKGSRFRVCLARASSLTSAWLPHALWAGPDDDARLSGSDRESAPSHRPESSCFTFGRRLVPLRCLRVYGRGPDDPRATLPSRPASFSFRPDAAACPSGPSGSKHPAILWNPTGTGASDQPGAGSPQPIPAFEHWNIYRPR
jgi:hypothetical protein